MTAGPHQDRRPQTPQHPDTELQQLTTVPADAFERALQHDLDSPHPIFLSEEDSRLAIGHALREAMEAQGVSVYHLHEQTGISYEFLENMLNGSGDISDSEPLHKLENTLHVRLSHL